MFLLKICCLLDLVIYISPSSQHPSHRWRPAERPTLVQQLPAALVRDLEGREITQEDYDMLLQLDRYQLTTTQTSTFTQLVIGTCKMT